MHARALAAVQERTREVIAGALAAPSLYSGSVAGRPVVLGAPRTNVVALTPRTLEGPILPAQHMDIGLIRFGLAEVVKMRHHRHG